jgi:hypothetical protein
MDLHQRHVWPSELKFKHKIQIAGFHAFIEKIAKPHDVGAGSDFRKKVFPDRAIRVRVGDFSFGFVVYYDFARSVELDDAERQAIKIARAHVGDGVLYVICAKGNDLHGIVSSGWVIAQEPLSSRRWFGHHAHKMSLKRKGASGFLARVNGALHKKCSKGSPVQTLVARMGERISG